MSPRRRREGRQNQGGAGTSAPPKGRLIRDSGYRGDVGTPYEVNLAWRQGLISDGAFKVYSVITACRRGILAEVGDRELAASAHVKRDDIPRYLAELTRHVPQWFAIIRRHDPDHPEHPGARSVYLVPFVTHFLRLAENNSHDTAELGSRVVDNPVHNPWKSCGQEKITGPLQGTSVAPYRGPLNKSYKNKNSSGSDADASHWKFGARETPAVTDPDPCAESATAPCRDQERPMQKVSPDGDGSTLRGRAVKASLSAPETGGLDRPAPEGNCPPGGAEKGFGPPHPTNDQRRGGGSEVLREVMYRFWDALAGRDGASEVGAARDEAGAGPAGAPAGGEPP